MFGEIRKIISELSLLLLLIWSSDALVVFMKSNNFNAFLFASLDNMALGNMVISLK